MASDGDAFACKDAHSFVDLAEIANGNAVGWDQTAAVVDPDATSALAKGGGEQAGIQKRSWTQFLG